MPKAATLLPIFLLCLAATLSWPGQGSAAEPREREQSLEQMNLRYQAEVAAEAMKEGVPFSGEKKLERNGYTILFLPKLLYVDNDALESMGDARSLKSGGGHTKGFGAGVLVFRKINDWATLGLAYDYVHAEYSGGATLFGGAVSSPQGELTFDGKSDERTDSHAFSLIFNSDLKDYGRFYLTLTQAFDYFDGQETQETWLNGARVASDQRDIDSRIRMTALTPFYELDFPLSDELTLVPYVGLNLTYTDNAGLNNFQTEDGHLSTYSWTHFLLGGASLKYRQGLFGAHVRGGFSKTFYGDKIPGYVTRVLAPGVIQSGYNVDADKGVFSAGAGLSYVIPEVGVLGLDYNGVYGNNVQGHTATFSLVIPF